MIIEVKYYKQYDLDIIGLREMGYPIGDMIKKSLIAYANHNPIKFSLQRNKHSINFSDTKSFRCRLKITDDATIKLLRNIRPRYRNSFCKMLLRESLSMQTLSVFYTDNEWIQYENDRKNVEANVIDINHASVKQTHLEHQNKIIREVTGVKEKPEETTISEKVTEFNLYSNKTQKPEIKTEEVSSKEVIVPKVVINEEPIETDNNDNNDELLSIFDGLMA